MMGKRKKKKKMVKGRRHSPDPSAAPSFTWMDNGEMHSLIPGERPSEAQIEMMTRKYQEEIRKSPLWDEMVKEYGKEKAEALLKECRIRVE